MQSLAWQALWIAWKLQVQCYRAWEAKDLLPLSAALPAMCDRMTRPPGTT